MNLLMFKMSIYNKGGEFGRWKNSCYLTMAIICWLYTRSFPVDPSLSQAVPSIFLCAHKTLPALSPKYFLEWPGHQSAWFAGKMITFVSSNLQNQYRRHAHRWVVLSTVDFLKEVAINWLPPMANWNSQHNDAKVVVIQNALPKSRPGRISQDILGRH